ncbi:MAG: GNAT family N-acetyltransferase [Acidimicrobiales bacterium]
MDKAVSPAEVAERLEKHLASWLGAWPPVRGRITVVGSARRAEPGWDGKVQTFAGVATTNGAVLSVPPGMEDAVRRLGQDLDEIAPKLGPAVGHKESRLGRGKFRWCGEPADSPDVGQWVERDDERVPDWLKLFNGPVLVAWDDDGHYGAGLGLKRHDEWGHELAVVTEESRRGRGLARGLVAQAARRVLAEGAVPTYLHAYENLASDQVATAAGFPDHGWQVLGLWPGGGGGNK